MAAASVQARIEKPKLEVSVHFEEYKSYNKLLRNWLVIFGIGSLAMLVTNKQYLRDIGPPVSSAIPLLLFFGIISQLILLGINKYVQWWMYKNAIDVNEGRLSLEKVTISERIAQMIWIDMVLDGITFLLYGLSIALFINYFF